MFKLLISLGMEPFPLELFFCFVFLFVCFLFNFLNLFILIENKQGSGERKGEEKESQAGSAM